MSDLHRFSGFELVDESGAVLAKCESGADLLKAHVRGYTRKDGTFVAEHDDKRQEKHPKKHPSHDKVKATIGSYYDGVYQHPKLGSRHVIRYDGKYYRTGIMRNSDLSGLLYMIDTKVK